MKVCILGTGVFGISIAKMLTYNNHEITMWTKFQEERDYIINNHSIKGMPDIFVDNEINISCNLEEAIKNNDIIIVAVPSNFVLEQLKEIAIIDTNKIVCIASKGIDVNTNKFISDLAVELGINNICYISGPTFAHELASLNKMGFTIAASNSNVSNVIFKLFNNDLLKLEITDDIKGVQLSGTLKNIFAIVCGLMDELDYSASTKALVINSLINELNDAIIKLSDSRTILSLAGIGDIWLTCTNNQSRNYTFGKLIAKSSKDEIDSYLSSNTVEGYDNLNIILKTKDIYDLNLPLIEFVNKIIKKQTSIDDMISFIINK